MRGVPAAGVDLAKTQPLPNGRLQAQNFGVVNSSTDPFNSSDLMTFFMFAPWRVPLSGIDQCANLEMAARTRERSAALSPGPPIMALIHKYKGVKI